jgi:isoleucyl-tRNA synthetase
MATLHESLVVLTQLMSPMVPFITEEVWQVLVRPVDANATSSVHLTNFPVANRSQIDKTLSDQVALTKRIVELGRAARAESGVKIRQPLQRALISAKGWAALPVPMKEQIAEELNVIDLEDIASADGELVDISIKANFRTLGTKFGGAVQEIAKAISTQNPSELVATLRANASAKVGEWEITLDDLVVTETPKSGWNVASHDGESVALDLALSPALISAGLVREVVRFIQDARKTNGFDISDRINITYNANAEVMAAIAADLAHIQGEVLATQMQVDNAMSTGDNELGLTVNLVKQA